jgi:homoserine kinase type II
MAVFTEVSAAEAALLAEALNLGRMTGLAGIKAGIENTNYFLDTERGAWVLTLFERLTAEQLPFYLHLMKHLAQHGIPVPDPQADARGNLLHCVAGKPAAVVNKLAGGHRLAPDHRHCEQVGAMLARMHLAGRDFARHQPNLRGLAWWIDTVPEVLPFLEPAQAELMRDELAFQRSLGAAAAALPSGPIHADLFRDNVMFDGPPDDDRLTGFFDFYFAGVDAWLFDIAVCLNDWCCDLESGALVEDRAAAFIAAYESVRPLEPAEARLLPGLLRAAAFRFWLSRLWDLHLPRDASLLKAHDPTHFERVLRARVAQPWHPTSAAAA